MRGNPGIWRAMAAARRANLAAAGLPAPVAGSWATTRRALLTALGATGVAAALPGAGLLAARGGRVAILGGGIAGLTALHYLVEAGVDARLYEARDRLGGRIHTVPATADAPAFERGGQLVNTDHRDIQALTAACGLALIDRKPGPHHTLVVRDGRVVPEAALADGLRAIAARIDRDAGRLAADFARVAPAIDRLSIRGYLDAHAALIPARWVRDLLEQTSRTEYGVEPGRASALELLFNLPVVDGERVEVLGGADERYVIAGGSSALAVALAARHRDRIETGRHATRIAEAGDGALRIAFRDGPAVTADRIVVAVPAPLTRRIDFAVALPAEWRAFIAAMELGRNEKIQVASAGAAWRDTVGSGGELWSADGDGAAASGWEGTVRGGAREVPTWTWFVGGDQAGRAHAELAAFDRTFARPPLAPDAVDRSFWHRDPLARGAYVNYPPGQLTRFASLLWVEDAAPVAAPGRILFAGEHLSDAFPGYMNGAAQTGRLAAEAVTGRALLPRAA